MENDLLSPREEAIVSAIRGNDFGRAFEEVAMSVQDACVRLMLSHRLSFVKLPMKDDRGLIYQNFAEDLGVADVAAVRLDECGASFLLVCDWELMEYIDHYKGALLPNGCLTDRAIQSLSRDGKAQWCQFNDPMSYRLSESHIVYNELSKEVSAILDSKKAKER